MKIKEVLEQTGLTDRAVRLYIANALVSPENQKSYTGRNSYEFSESDVEQLQKIALLRRADFSIEQIRLLQQGGPAAGEMLAEFLTEKREQTERNRKILTALEEYHEDPTVDEVCRRLEEGFREEPLPKEDLRPTWPERIEGWVFRIIALAGMAVNGITLFGMHLVYSAEFRFPKFYTGFSHYWGTIYVVVPILLFGAVLWMYLRTRLNREVRRKRRIRAIWLVVIEILFRIVFTPWGTAGLMLAPPVYSETQDPKNYMILGDEEAHSADLLKLFPTGIPSSGVDLESLRDPPVEYLDTTRYYYFRGDFIDPSFEIYAQWELPPEKLAAEQTRLYTAFDGYEIETEQRGDWTCLHFDDGQPGRMYDYLFFAWNEEQGLVRYVAAYAMDEFEKGPMFLELDWE